MDKSWRICLTWTLIAGGCALLLFHIVTAQIDQFQQFQQQQPFQQQPFQQFQQQPFQQFQPGFQQVGFQTGQSQSLQEFIDMNRNWQDPRFWRDRREREGWWMMYPFGEIAFDIELLNQPNLDRQIDFDFYFPFYGFRYNYTYIIPNGILAFSRPEWIQPPWTFPNPKWPERRDASFIAPFFADATYQYVGETGISHVWYRTLHRPRIEDWIGAGIGGAPQAPRNLQQYGPILANQFGQTWEGRKVQPGYVEDTYMLDNITKDVQEAIIGAQGFQALHACIVTWERFAYGGAPKVVEIDRFEQVQRWQNTYQVVLASDEIRSYVIFNYANINWTSANEAGALTGRGGMQSAMAGFNGGNGTGWYPLHYSGEGEIFKLMRYTPSEIPGRWVYRVDEEIIRGGCSNESTGFMYTAPTEGSMLGGYLVNVSGMCIRQGDNVVVLFDEFTTNCRRINMGRASCVVPKFHKIGMISTKISRDGGHSFPYVGTFYIIHPERALPTVLLEKDVLDVRNNWDHPDAEVLTMTWGATNLTWNLAARVNIELWGFWEDTEKSSWERVGVISQAQPNLGRYQFNPRTLTRVNVGGMDNTLSRMWKWYEFGTIRVNVPDDPAKGVFYSGLTSFSWYFKPDWLYYYGNNWATDRCIEWFEYDGNRRNFIADLHMTMQCPCTLDQALLDLGRYMPVFQCDRDGDSSCPMHRGAQHCAMSVWPTWTGGQQVCCYDFEGWLMMSDDYETPDILKYYSPGTPYRSHTMGAYPYKIPPWIPSMSNWMNDIMPYHMCCKFAQHCEFFFWRRQTDGCQDYRPPAAGFAYGEPHFVTFDGIQYSFNGRGYYVLVMSDHPRNKLMVQVRMEQPPKTIWNVFPNATLITGVAMQENDSDVVQILARKDFRRWRYHADVLVNGIPVYFDTAEKKWLKFRGVSIFSPMRNTNHSELVVQFASGVGVRVQEAFGLLDVLVALPPSYNETYKWLYGRDQWGRFAEERRTTSEFRPSGVDQYYRTYGLLGTYNQDPYDDLMTPDGSTPVRVANTIAHTDAETRMIYYQFGERWRVDGSNPRIGPVLFQDRVRPIYNPLLFSDPRPFTPEFDSRFIAPNATLIFSMREVADTCQNNWACKYDYIQTGIREIAINTLAVEQKFLGLRTKGRKWHVSCGALLKAYGVVKTPVGNNYLDGVTVTFTCRPEYFIHGDSQRTCINGTWTPGWHVWCRLRSEENALKWFTGIIVSLGILAFISAIFCCCYCIYVRPLRRKTAGAPPYARQKPRPAVFSTGKTYRPPELTNEGMEPVKMPPPPPALSQSGSSGIMQLESEPGPAKNGQPRVHLHGLTQTSA